MAPHKHDCSAITNQLYQSALRLTKGDREASKELVQQVWEKVLAKGIYNSSKCPTPFLLKVLKNHYYDQQRAKNRVVHPGDDHLPLVVDKPDKHSAIWEQILSLIQSHKDGWIYREILDKDLDLKTLAQKKCVKYNTLCQKKKAFGSIYTETIEDKGGNKNTAAQPVSVINCH